MEIITPQTLRELTAESDDFYVTIVMPTKPIVGGNIENPVYLKGLIKKSEELLSDTHLNHKGVKEHTEKVRKILEVDTFWRDQFSSLVVYFTKDFIRTFKLPIELEERVSVSHFCNLLPLLQYTKNNYSYYILVIDEGENRLFIANNFNIDEITTEKMKISKVDYLKFLDIEEVQSYHVENPGERTKNHEAVIYHGHGNMKDERKIRASQYLNDIDKEVIMATSGKNIPMILAGHDFLISIFSNITDYPNIIHDNVRTNPGPLDINKLHEYAKEIIKSHILNLEKTEKSKYCNLLSKEKDMTDIYEIIHSAYYGDVDTLFVDLEKSIFGTFEMKNEKINIDVTDDPMDENLSNLAVIFSTKTDAKILTPEKKNMPEKVPVCAIRRFSL